MPDRENTVAHGRETVMPDREQSSEPDRTTMDTLRTLGRREFLSGALGLAGLTATGLALAACGSSSPSSSPKGTVKPFNTVKPITLTMWNQPTWANAVTERKYWSDLSAAFHKKYPNVTLQVDWISWNSSFEKDVEAIKSGNPPDLEQTGAEQMVYMASLGGGRTR